MSGIKLLDRHQVGGELLDEVFPRKDEDYCQNRRKSQLPCLIDDPVIGVALLLELTNNYVHLAKTD